MLPTLYPYAILRRVCRLAAPDLQSLRHQQLRRRCPAAVGHESLPRPHQLDAAQPGGYDYARVWDRAIPHTLCIADVMSEVEPYAQKSGGAVRLIEEPEISPRWCRRTPDTAGPSSWSVNVPYLSGPRRARRGAGPETRRAGVISTASSASNSRADRRGVTDCFSCNRPSTMPVIRRRADLFESTSIFRNRRVRRDRCAACTPSASPQAFPGAHLSTATSPSACGSHG